MHKGDDCCRYIITWSQTQKFHWKLVRNYLLLGSFLAFLSLPFVLPLLTWGIIALISALLTALISYYTEYLDKKALTRTIEIQKEAAQDSIVESNITIITP